MEEILKKSKELKLKMLKCVENKLTHTLSCKDLLDLAQCVNHIEEDKTYYERLLTSLTKQNNSFPNGFNGFGSGEMLLSDNTKSIEK